MKAHRNSPPHCDAPIDAIPSPRKALVEVQVDGLHVPVSRDVLWCRVIVVIHLKPFPLDASNVFSNILCCEDVVANVRIWGSFNQRPPPWQTNASIAPYAIGMALLPHDGFYQSGTQLNARDSCGGEKNSRVCSTLMGHFTKACGDQILKPLLISGIGDGLGNLL